MPRLQTISVQTKLALIDNIRSQPGPRSLQFLYVVAKTQTYFPPGDLETVNSVFVCRGGRGAGQGVTVLLFSQIKGIH